MSVKSVFLLLPKDCSDLRPGFPATEGKAQLPVQCTEDRLVPGRVSNILFYTRKIRERHYNEIKSFLRDSL